MKKTFQPMGLIPLFNAWGNHPDDMIAFIRDKVKELYKNCNLQGYEKAEAILLKALDDLSSRPNTFTGHYIPSESTKAVLTWLITTFVQVDKCQLIGQKNYEQALKLMQEGHNVVAVMNHATALDCMIAEALTSKITPAGFTPSYIASQVFEYSRIANIVTSGFDKFPVFQPKHIEKMRQQSTDSSVVAEMRKQNLITIRAICRHVSIGGKMIFLFPEKSRAANMGVPEPIVAKLPDIIQKASSKEVYILPTYVSGGESIFPNAPGTNELDNFLQNLRVGYGNLYCGEPIPFSRINETICYVDKNEMVNSVLGEVSSDKDYLHLSAVSIMMLGSIASLCPDNTVKALYSNTHVTQAVEMLQD